LHAQIANLQYQNSNLQKQNVTLQTLADELHRIYNTRSWKLLNAVYKIKSKLFK